MNMIEERFVFGGGPAATAARIRQYGLAPGIEYVRRTLLSQCLGLRAAGVAEKFACLIRDVCYEAYDENLEARRQTCSG